jgi:hypothetical protein
MYLKEEDRPKSKLPLVSDEVFGKIMGIVPDENFGQPSLKKYWETRMSALDEENPILGYVLRAHWKLASLASDRAQFELAMCVFTMIDLIETQMEADAKESKEEAWNWRVVHPAPAAFGRLRSEIELGKSRIAYVLYPGEGEKVVAASWFLTQGDQVWSGHKHEFAKLAEARVALSATKLVSLGRDLDDDPSILEVWA